MHRLFGKRERTRLAVSQDDTLVVLAFPKLAKLFSCRVWPYHGLYRALGFNKYESRSVAPSGLSFFSFDIL